MEGHGHHVPGPGHANRRALGADGHPGGHRTDRAAFPFDPNGGHGYVWHCHIVDHEDNEMMRPTEVMPNNGTRTYMKGTDY